MASQRPQRAARQDRRAQTRHRVAKWIAALLGAGVLAAVTAFGTGLGSKAVNGLDAEGPPLSYSAEELGGECGSVVFLPEAETRQALNEGLPNDWLEFQHQPGAVYVNRDVVELAVQGESSRTVTLTGIRFQ